jgi:hypothetical protein
MSNSLAIATTTVALSAIAKGGLGEVSGAKVTTVRPDEKTAPLAEPEVNIFLCQVTQNAALANEDLPTRAPGGDLRRRPQIALDLSYVVSFYGNERTLEPQRLLGGTVAALHAHPLVDEATIQAIVQEAAAATLEEPARYLAKTDLAAQLQRVAFAPLSLDLEQLSRLWSVLFRVPYVLSVAYKASVLLIEAPLAAKQARRVEKSKLAVSPSVS